MSSSSTVTTNNSNDVSPQQIGKAFVVQYYRLLHEHPESLHRFYSTSSTFMHDDPTKTVIGTEAIAKRIEELALKLERSITREHEFREKDGLRTATWMKDEDVKECCQCKKEFSQLRRKHHCRK